MILSFMELVDMLVMTAFVGYIFMDSFQPKRLHRDVLDIYAKKGFDFEAFKFAAMVTAPAIILHELGHKFAAMGFGLTAEFHAAYMWLAIGLAMKLMNTGFIFFVPAYVSILGNATPAAFSITAFAGPFVNLLLWLGSLAALKFNIFKRKYTYVLLLTQKINMFLFIFNMLPLPMFDGYKVFSGLIQAFF